MKRKIQSIWFVILIQTALRILLTHQPDRSRGCILPPRDFGAQTFIIQSRSCARQFSRTAADAGSLAPRTLAICQPLSGGAMRCEFTHINQPRWQLSQRQRRLFIGLIKTDAEVCFSHVCWRLGSAPPQPVAARPGLDNLFDTVSSHSDWRAPRRAVVKEDKRDRDAQTFHLNHKFQDSGIVVNTSGSY